MKIHGHEIPEEFVREIEAVILRQTETFYAEWIRHALGRSGAWSKAKATTGLGGLGWMSVSQAVVAKVFARLRKEGKIEHLGRGLGWRVTRSCTTSAT